MMLFSIDCCIVSPSRIAFISCVRRETLTALRSRARSSVPSAVPDVADRDVLIREALPHVLGLGVDARVGRLELLGERVDD